MRLDGKAFQILVVEDNPWDVMMMQRALEEHHIPAELEILGDGKGAIERFERPGDPEIDLVLLDLNLPLHNGLIVLERLRACAVWQSIPVIIITSAESDSLPVLSQWLGANLYFKKSMDLNKFMELGVLVRQVLQS